MQNMIMRSQRGPLGSECLVVVSEDNGARQAAIDCAGIGGILSSIHDPA